jgi:hypothetical protein
MTARQLQARLEKKIVELVDLEAQIVEVDGPYFALSKIDVRMAQAINALVEAARLTEKI